MGRVTVKPMKEKNSGGITVKPMKEKNTMKTRHCHGKRAGT